MRNKGERDGRHHETTQRCSQRPLRLMQPQTQGGGGRGRGRKGAGGGEQPFCCESSNCTAPDITKRGWEEEETVCEGNKTESVASPGLRKTQVSRNLRVKTKLVYITTEKHWVRTTSVLCKQSKGLLKFSNVERNFCDWNRDSLTLSRRTLQKTRRDTMETRVTLGLQQPLGAEPRFLEHSSLESRYHLTISEMH